MNKRDLTDEEKKIIQGQQDNSPVVRFLRSKDRFNFGVGDFLIKVNKRNDKWEAETISSVSSQPKRFVCIHEDEYGIKYIKPLTSLGKELPYIHALTEVSDWTRYEVDPEFAEHIILDGENEFSFAEKRKQDKARREAITKKNKKISERISTADIGDAVIRSLKPGDRIWMDYTIPGAAESEPWTVISCQETSNTSYSGYRPKTMQMTVSRPNDGRPYQTNFTSDQILGWVIIRTEPFKYETV